MQRDNIDAVRRNVDGACTGCSGGRLRFLVVIRTVLTVAFLANFVATLVQFPLFHVPAAGSTDLYSEHNFVHLLPAFACLRPLWLLVRFKSLRRVLQNFALTVYKARDVFFLLGILLLVGSISGTILFAGKNSHMSGLDRPRVLKLAALLQDGLRPRDDCGKLS